WPPAWRCWLRFLAADLVLSVHQRHLLLENLLDLHRRRLTDHLARNEVDRARRHWNLVHRLPELAQGQEVAFVQTLGEAVARFREDLATEYLTTTREAMRHGAIPPG